jgi:myo-inositol-1(or 4)-monophosphatase
MDSSPLIFATSLALEVGDLLEDYFHNHQLDPNLKADNTLVTQADLAADQLIQREITQQYPEDGLLTEESQTVYPDSKEYVWVVDPLDGTTNFSLGLHYWGVSIARLKAGRPETAVLYFPLVEELYSAQRDEGAFFNQEALTVQPPQKHSPASFFACCSRTYKHYQVEVPYKTRSLGSAAYHLCTVAHSTAILALEITPKLWDIAGAWLVVEEAGGVIQTLNSPSPFPARPGTDYEQIKYTTLAAATAEGNAFAQSKLSLIS